MSTAILIEEQDVWLTGRTPDFTKQPLEAVLGDGSY